MSLIAGALLARAAPYAIGVLALATVGASVTAYVLSARLETAQLERDQAVTLAEANRKAAADEKTAKQLSEAASAERVAAEVRKRAASDAALQEYRNTEKGEANACHFAVVDPSVDRLLARPADQGRSPPR